MPFRRARIGCPTGTGSKKSHRKAGRVRPVRADIGAPLVAVGLAVADDIEGRLVGAEAEAGLPFGVVARGLPNETPQG